MSCIDDIEREVDKIELNNAKGRPVIRLGLIATLYFRHGYHPAVRKRIAACFSDFHAEFGDVLRAIVYRRRGRLTPGKLQSALERFSAEGEGRELNINSARSVHEAESHCLQVLTEREVCESVSRSYIKMTMPWQMLKSQDDVDRFQAWVMRLADRVDAEHGYAGLSPVLPYDFDSCSHLEYAIARTYPGLEADTHAYAASLKLAGFIKGINWLTLVSRPLLERLGGLDLVRTDLSSHEGIQCLEYAGGLAIRAGARPELGSETEPPVRYVTVNRVMRPLRSPDQDELQSYSFDGEDRDKDPSSRWYARFDQN
ncbi:type VI immunity family protein [Stenotrophomonas maltophilia]|jgi:hypothetical protein|uniref:type VI immunity family protein n=1 Tax=Stenotrophomonas maltophilia TaxID=40324 RepID=UPI00066A956B|nr:type VI immunity family protein [Stenotrophomonas maltophilia]RRU69641.1 DUF3396 domain-containing protein [Stenotrophomonas maltophilia]